ncbi:MAG: matrixin family metalloprotease [Bacteriovoracaceae bacterium]
MKYLITMLMLLNLTACEVPVLNEDRKMIWVNHGAEDFPHVLKVPTSMQAQYGTAISNAVSTWNTELGTTAFEVEYQNSVNWEDDRIVLKEETFKDGKICGTDNYKVAYTNFHVKTATTHSIEIQLFCLTKDLANYDFETVIVRELGRSLGLGFINSPNSVLHKEIKTTDVRKTLSNDDQDELYRVY